MAAATMYTNETTTRTAWETRARELAKAHHTIGTARWLESEDCFIVPAASRVEPYRVRVTDDGVPPACECVAGSRNRPCKHAGAALFAAEKRQAAIAEATRHAATWYAEWLAVEYPAW